MQVEEDTPITSGRILMVFLSTRMLHPFDSTSIDSNYTVWRPYNCAISDPPLLNDESVLLGRH